jgi:hypothetical protein
MRAEGVSIIIAERVMNVILQLRSTVPFTVTELHSDRLMH